jgi:hypothetical protein
VALNQEAGRYYVSDFLNGPYKITYIIPRSGVLLEKLTFAQVSNLFPAFYATLRLIRPFPVLYSPNLIGITGFVDFVLHLAGARVPQSVERVTTGWTTERLEFESR